MTELLQPARPADHFIAPSPARHPAPRNRATRPEAPLLELKAASKHGPTALGTAELLIGWCALVVPLWFAGGDAYATFAPTAAKPSEVVHLAATAAASTLITVVVGIGSVVTARRKRARSTRAPA